MARRTVVIIGGVAGGASCATRLRRMDENAEIILVERGPFASFANCGLPYFVGGVIPREQNLLVVRNEVFGERFRIDLRTRHEAVAIDTTSRSVEIRDLETNRSYRQSYDALVLAPGATPLRPALPGIELPGIFTVRTIPDARTIKDWIHHHSARTAVVVGGGFIGLEMAENLAHLGLDTTIVEMLPQIMPPLDPEMASFGETHIEAHGVHLALGDAVTGFAERNGGLEVETASGKRHPADLVILAIGVRPETALARSAGLEIGARGGIRVDPQMRTSDPRIWAVGDAVEVRDRVTHEWTLLALAGPANRQGRVAADTICGLDAKFDGVIGTAICGFFGFQIGSTGASEKTLRRSGIAFEKIYLHASNHAGYYPGAQRLHLKLLFRKSDGLILGAQAAGAGVDKRIDVLAMAIQKAGTVHDLTNAELAYAPQFGSARDPVNLAGMVAVNHLLGNDPIIHWEDLADSSWELIDVRDPDEFAAGHPPDARNIPLEQLRENIRELPTGRPLAICCAAGSRAHQAVRILRQKGFDAHNVAGGFETCESLRPSAPMVES